MATQMNSTNRPARTNGGTATMTTATIDNAQNALSDTRATIAREEAKLQELQTKLGVALAAHRVGEKDAQKRAATLSMDLGKLRSNLEVLRSEERALVSRYDSQIKADEADRIATLQAGANALVTEMEETEQAFADAMRQAMVLAKQLQGMDREAHAYRKQLGLDLPEGFRQPRQSARLFNLEALERSDDWVDRWLASKVHEYQRPGVASAPATKRAPVYGVSQGDDKPPVWLTRGGN